MPDSENDRSLRNDLERARIEEVAADIVALSELMSALFREKDRASTLAEHEREKAASALRTGLEVSISAGDERLREHVLNQITQVNAALHSSELLETERINNVRENVDLIATSVDQRFERAHEDQLARMDTLRREIAMSADAANADRHAMRTQLEANASAAKEAVTKAEVATEKRLEGMNEFRAQLTDQSNTFLPRETFQSVIDGWNVWREGVEKRLNQGLGDHAGRAEQRADLRATLATVFGIIAVAVTIAIAVLTH